MQTRKSVASSGNIEAAVVVAVCTIALLMALFPQEIATFLINTPLFRTSS